MVWLVHGYIYRWPSTRKSDAEIDAALTPLSPGPAIGARQRLSEAVKVRPRTRAGEARYEAFGLLHGGLAFPPIVPPNFTSSHRISMSKKVKKVVLAYSGGLDTSIILKWLQTNYGSRS